MSKRLSEQLYCLHVEQTNVNPMLIGRGDYRRWHFSSRKRFADAADATHRGAMWAGKRETRWLYVMVCFAL